MDRIIKMLEKGLLWSLNKQHSRPMLINNRLKFVPANGRLVRVDSLRDEVKTKDIQE